MKFIPLLFCLACPVLLSAQRITYAETDQADSRRTNFDIVGKVNGNILIFKNNRSDNFIGVYDDDMKLVGQERLSFMPESYINVDFINYPEFCYMIYEYQHKNIIHCTAVKLDGMGKRIGPPMDLDTTQIGFASNNKIYNVIFSEDKERVLVFKINSKNPRNYLFTTFLFNKQLEPLDRHRIYLPMEERNELFTSFLLDNEGTFAFAKYYRNAGSDYISRVSLVTKSPLSDTFAIRDIGTNERLLDEIKIKIDNNNKRYILSGFYYRQRKGNIEGLYTAVWDKETDTKLKETVTIFTDELRALAKSSEANLKMAFNDFFIKNIIVEKDGGYLLVSESEYTTSRGSPFNRWDYMYGYNPYTISPMGYYYNPYSPWNRYGVQNGYTRYNAENIMVLSFDKEGNLEWSNVIPKSQYDDDSENLISHHTVNTGGELHFLYNQYERKTMLLSDQSITPDGKINRYPTLRNLDKGYEFMPRYGKQVSSNQIVLPCLYRNYLCFAKIDF